FHCIHGDARFMSVQRRPSPASASTAAEGELESTAELPVLDVASYEAEHSGNTDTWVVPSPLAREVLHATAPSSSGNTIAKAESLAEIEKTLAQANSDRSVADQRIRQLEGELAKAREAANRSLQAHDKDVEVKLALRDKALCLVQRDLTEAQELANTYLEALRSAEGRR